MLWMPIVVVSSVFGLFQGFIFGSREESWLTGLAFGLGGAAVMGVIWSLWWPGQLRRKRRIFAAEGVDFDSISFSERRRINRPSFHGPIPTDERTRRAAVAWAKSNLDDQRRMRPVFVIVLIAFLTGAVLLAVLRSPEYALLVVPLLGFGAFVNWMPRRTERRISELESGGSASAGVSHV